MGLEAATYIHQLNPLNPVGAVDPKAQGDDHIRMIKATIQATFPNITGPVLRTQGELNTVTGYAAPTIPVGPSGAAAGVATTALRSDAKLVIDLTANYTWTGIHSFTGGPQTLRISDGNTGVATPGLAFAADVDTGFGRPGNDAINIILGGSNSYSFTTTVFSLNIARAGDGAIGTPAYSFGNDINTGMYRAASDDVRICAGGVDGIAVQSAAVFAQLPLNIVNGAAGAGNNSVRFGNDTDTGFYRVSADYMAFEAGGSFVYAIRNISGNVKIQAADGTAAEPIYVFNNEPTTGLYRIGAGQLGFSELGTGFRIGFRQVPRSTTATTLAIGDVGKCVAVSAAINIPASVFSAGDCVSIYNDSGASVNITTSAGTLRLAGTTSTGTRSLSARGMATLWFNVGGATPEAICSGAGVG